MVKGSTKKIVNNYSTKKNIMILCGHYKGIDQRIRDIYITHEISIGDYVLSGGELGAAVLTDAILRIIPGAINNEESALTDSFQDDLLAPPVYTRPANFRGHKVPNVLTSGDFPKIEKWREDQAMKRTQDRRPDLLTDSKN
jgi:tRNA (guanine37-N1)-methyltransferase